MKRLLPALLVLYSGIALAAEGMWQPHQIPQLGKELKQLGLKLDPRSLTRLTEHPMNAVIDLGGCTASFVSPTGLLVTNHHCASGSLQYNSTEQRNLLVEGFVASSLQEELPAAPGSRVRVTVEVREITDEITAGLRQAAGGVERYELIEDREKRQIAACENEPGYRCRVRSFHGGLSYYLVKQLEIRDVRLVYAPPSSIGKFGGDVDNWMWPRHTGDFTFLRAYVGRDGKPADYSENNRPFEPEHFLGIAPGGIAEGDLVMVVGYPGRTNRYRLSGELENAFRWYYPTARDLAAEALRLIDEETRRVPDARIKYLTSVDGLNNAMKNYQGMLDGFARSDALERKQALEAELQRWVRGAEELGDADRSSLGDLRALVERRQSTQVRDLLLGRISRSTMVGTARRLYRLSLERNKPDGERKPGYQERDLQRLRERMTRLERRYHPAVDKALLRFYLDRYRALPRDQRLPDIDAAFGIGGTEEALDHLLDELYRETRLGETEERLALMKAGSGELEDSDDPFIRLAVALHPAYLLMEKQDEAVEGELRLVRPRYMKTLVGFLEGRGHPVYADANSSLRITYGTVGGYAPRDGVYYRPFTRLEGILEKFTGEDPFNSPKRQLRLIEAGEHGSHRLDALDSVPVNFMSDVDTTGGNSGSPTLNGKGELVGLLFDGTYDSINADWDFNEQTTRAIHVDIRYMLWVMEKVDRAQRVLKELGLVAAD